MAPADARYLNPLLARHRQCAITDRESRRDWPALAKRNWQRREADATSADLIGKRPLQKQPNSALADVLVAREPLRMVGVRDLNWRGCGFVVIFL